MDLKEYFREVDTQPEIYVFAVTHVAGSGNFFVCINHCYGQRLVLWRRFLTFSDLAIAADEATFGLSEINSHLATL